jgi:hypothetical protein
MQLLYCNSSLGTVVSSHDSAQNLSVSAYADADRIIPYPDSVQSLPRVGALPDGWTVEMGDQRPWAQPTETPALLIGFASQVRWETSTAGISYTVASGTIPLETDRVSQTLVGNLAQYAATLSDQSTQIDFTQNGIHYPVLASEVPGMFAAINDVIQQGRTIEAACIADLNSGSPTILTYADVEAKFTGVMAMTRHPRAQQK